MRGNSIKLLHEKLMSLGYVINDDEIKKKFFGDSTKQAIEQLQSKHGLIVSGISDESTAMLLDELSSSSNKKQKKFDSKTLQEKTKKTAETLSFSEPSNILPPAITDDTITNFEITLKNSNIFVKPSVLFENLIDLNNLKREADSQEIIKFVESKLNNQLHLELINAISESNIDDDEVDKILKETISKIDYKKFLNSKLSDVFDAVFASVKRDQKNIDQKINQLKEQLPLIISQRKVSDLLHLDSSLHNNPIFHTEMARAKILEYAKIANLNDKQANALAGKTYLVLNDFVDDSSFSELVDQKILDNNDQKDDLKLVFSLGLLGGGNNIQFVKALKDIIKNNQDKHTTKSILDFVDWQKEDWLKLIIDKKIPLPPENNSAEDYAKTILRQMEITFPSQSLLACVLNESNLKGKYDLLDSLNILLENNEKIVAETGIVSASNTATNSIIATVSDSIDWSRIDPQRQRKLQNDLEDLTKFANTYRHLGVASLINDKNLNISQKKEHIGSRIHSLDTFYKNNLDVDIRFVDFFDKQNLSDNLNWNGINNTNEKKLVRKQLMVHQRMLSMAQDTTDMEILLGKGYDSALAISNETEESFVNKSGLSNIDNARSIHRRAVDTSNMVSLIFEAVDDVANGGLKDITAASNKDLNTEIINVLRDIDGWENFFGPQNYCACKECNSILSPAAYFVDTMYFIEKKISEPNFSNMPSDPHIHPLHLKKRRGDLWKLKLSCENTNTEIPYLIIVNEVLENYLNDVVSDNIFNKMSWETENISFSVPFNLPLEELRIYLKHFGDETSLHQIYELLKKPEDKIWRARLNLSAEEFNVIDKDNSTNRNNVLARFGNPASVSNSDSFDFDVQEFIRIVGINREQLDDLLSINFNSDLKNIKIQTEQKPDDMHNFSEKLVPLTIPRLDFIHRFIRLWKKTPWSIKELDLVLTSMNKVNPPILLNKPAVVYIAKLVDIQEKLKLKNVDELCSMFYHLPVSEQYPHPPHKEEDKRLFERLFDPKKIFPDDPPMFYHYSFNINADPDNENIDPKTPLLLGGLGISETELLLLFEILNRKTETESETETERENGIPFDDNGKCNLNEERISLLYRHARLAKALKFKIEDFVHAIYLNFSDSLFPIIDSLEKIFKLVDFQEWLKRDSPLSVSELWFILRGEESGSIKFKNNFDTIAKMVQEIQEDPDVQTSSRVTALKENILKSFNLSESQLNDFLKWTSNSNLDRPEIHRSLNVSLNTGTPLSTGILADLKPLLDLIKEIERILMIFTKLKFDEEIVSNITDGHPSPLGISDLTNLRFEDLKALVSYNKITATLDDENKLVMWSVLDDYLNSNGLSSIAIDFLAALWNTDQSMVDSIANSLPLPNAHDNNDSPISIDVAGKVIEYIQNSLDVCKTLGINGYSLKKIADANDFDELNIAKDISLGAFISKYDDEKTRKEKLEPYQDKINIIKRDALTDYILAHEKHLKFKDLSDIYAFFLLDVEIGGCFRTSRVVAAISSLLLYVHRCLQKLEQLDPDIEDSPMQIIPSEEARKEWEWRKNYRIWEANRKVFTYPENYLEPDLREDKTPLFKELEEELLQEKITMESAEAAYKKYVSQFVELAHLRISGSYYYEDSERNGNGNSKTTCYYFFGHTTHDPPQYYYRKWIDQKLWTPWEKIELSINSNRISAIIHLGKLYIFWVENTQQERIKFKDGTEQPPEFTYKKDLLYSFLNEQGKWIPPQKVNLISNPTRSDERDASQHLNYSETSIKKGSPDNIVFPIIDHDGQLIITVDDYGYDKAKQASNSNYRHWSDGQKRVIDRNKPLAYHINFFTNTSTNQLPSSITPILPRTAGIHYWATWNKNDDNENQIALKSFYSNQKEFEAMVQAVMYQTVKNVNSLKRVEHTGFTTGSAGPFPGDKDLTSFFDATIYHELLLVGNKPGSFIFTFDNQQYLIRYVLPRKRSARMIKDNIRMRYSYRLNTSISDILTETLFNKGLHSFLLPSTQQTSEFLPAGLNFPDPYALVGPVDNSDHIDFEGSYGIYYCELFFHIPFLIAHHLNANQKFEESKWWYERIFDPTANEPTEDGDIPTTEHNWRYLKFRGLGIEKLKMILTNEEAIKKYKIDPFNPHAIAGLRPTAYQKTIIMKYIDNLIDWGDYLFAQDTRESINEATMLYVLASDILGKRPSEIGTCETVDESILTYGEIGPQIDAEKGNDESEFLIMLENWNITNAISSEERETLPFVTTDRSRSRDG